MALNVFHLFCFVFVIFLDFSLIGDAKREMPNNKITSSFTFLDHLQGCHKGNKTKGISQLKTYLQKFGYLDRNQIHANNDEFDDALEYAIKTYQQNYNIEPTGVLDAKTVSKMAGPRCGVPDIVNGINTMQRGKKTHASSSNSSQLIYTVSHYSFFSGNPRWPQSLRHLTYGFLPNTPTSARAPVRHAFETWASVSNFTFSLVRNYRNANLVIGFYRGDHGDGAPFDDRVLAHAFVPTDGRLHFNADQRWSTGTPTADAFDLESVALHEIGHLLGLGHSSLEEAIMYPKISHGSLRLLYVDDIEGIRALYNL